MAHAMCTDIGMWPGSLFPLIKGEAIAGGSVAGAKNKYSRLIHLLTGCFKTWIRALKLLIPKLALQQLHLLRGLVQLIAGPQHQDIHFVDVVGGGEKVVAYCGNTLFIGF